MTMTATIKQKNNRPTKFRFFLSRCSWLPLLLLFLFASRLSAEELIVPDDYFSITEAMELAESGDTIIVMPGTYNERIAIKEGVNLCSFVGDDGNELVAGPGQKKILKRTLRTIIDGSDLEEPGYLISFASDTTAAMKVDGFTLQNLPKYISGINLFLMEIRGCSPVVVNNVFTGNRSWGGILATGLGVGMGPALETEARPLIENNIVYANDGPGIANGGNSSATIVNNEIFNNEFPKSGNNSSFAPAVGIRENGRPIIDNNFCYANEVGIGAINFASHVQPLIIKNNKIFNNKRAGIGLRGIDGKDTDIRAIIKNNKIYGNLTAGIRCTKLDRIEIDYNVIFDNRRTGISLWNVDKAVIEDNEIHGNMTAGIRLLAVPDAGLRHNNIYQNVTAGIDIIGWHK
jgi:parallel beta-helix repeat protein